MPSATDSSTAALGAAVELSEDLRIVDAATGDALPLRAIVDALNGDATDRRMPNLEPATELHAYARRSAPRKGNVPPPSFVAATGRVEALEGQLADARAELQGLMRDAYAQGVAVSTLARWAGYTPRWVSEILKGDS